MKISSTLIAAAVALASYIPALGVPGKILVMNDEWTLSDFGYGQNANAGPFALNIASWITGGGPGTFHAYSGNFGLTGASLASTMSGAGHVWTVGTGFAFTLPNIQGFDAIFLAGNPADNSVLIDYVNGGGTVVVEGGTGLGGSADEAARWNPFLNAFGLAFEGASYNGVGGNIPISSPHPLFTGISSLYQNNGNDVLDISAVGPATVLVTDQGHGLYGVYEPAQAVPEGGSSVVEIGLGLLALVAASRLKLALG